MQRVFFDVTSLRMYLKTGNRLSGIQRVTVMLIEHAARQIGPEKVFLSFHDKKTGAYQAVPFETVDALGGVLSTDALVLALNRRHASKNKRPTLERYARKPVKRAIQTTIRNLNAAVGNHKHFTKRKSTLEAWRASARPGKQTAISAPPVDFFGLAQKGDKIILADAAWSVPLDRMKQAQSQGISCHFLIHDLIQIKAPELIGGTEQSLIFHDWLLETTSFVDSYMANSKATARDLREFLDAYGRAQRIDVVPLAAAGVPTLANNSPEHRTPGTVNADVYPRLASTFHVKDQIRSLLKRPYVLCVGTMELRKNMWSLVQAWDRLRHRDDIELPKLVFAGNPGWLNFDYERLMSETGNLHGWVEPVFSPSDEELDFLYRNCLFTAMPSFFEGWGLPVGESLSYGKTGIISNTSSLPEVGEDLVLYFDPHSISSITSTAYRMLSEKGLREDLEVRIAQADLRAWDDVAADVLAAVS